MTSLTALWEASLALCGIGSLALAVLLMARVISTSRSKRREAARRRVLPLLLGSAELQGRLTGLDLRIAAKLTCELAELTRGSDLEALLDRAEKMGVAGILARWMKSGSPQRRLTAVETLGLFPVDGLKVTAALDDRNRDVRLGAGLVLAQRLDGPPPNVLVRKLRIGTTEHSLLITTLMTDLAARDPDAVAALLFDRNVPYEAKVAATDALAQLGERFAPMLALMAQGAQAEPELQQRIFRALGRTGHPAGAGAILEGLQSNDAPVRAAAAEAAGKAGLMQASEALGGLLADPNWDVRYQAAAALLRLGRPGLATLWHAAEGDDEQARLAARTMLAEARVA